MANRLRQFAKGFASVAAKAAAWPFRAVWWLIAAIARGLWAIVRGIARGVAMAIVGTGRWFARLPGRIARLIVAVARVIPSLVRRGWALAILAILLGTGYIAVSYLISFVFYPPEIPAQFQPAEVRPTIESLNRDAADGKPVRAPLGHYHGVDRWLHPDPHNSCTAAGCHGPLPHSKAVTMRAFTNLHATFIACQTCHAPGTQRPAAMTWLNLASGRPQESPAILRLTQLLQSRREQVQRERQAEEDRAAGKPSTQPEESKRDPQQDHAQIVPLLEQTIAVVGSDGLLEYIRMQIDTSEPGSPVWRHAVEQLTDELPQHARGDYAAKLALADRSGWREAEISRLTPAFLASKPDSAERAALHKQVHESILPKPDGCLACHSDGQTLIDFASVGYTRERAGKLRSLPPAGLIQRIPPGGEFPLPGLLEGE